MLAVEIMLALMFFTWGAAIWSSFPDEGTDEQRVPQQQQWRKVA